MALDAAGAVFGSGGIGAAMAARGAAGAVCAGTRAVTIAAAAGIGAPGVTSFRCLLRGIDARPKHEQKKKTSSI